MVPCRRFSRIASLYPLDACSILPLPPREKCLQTLPNWPRLKTSGLEEGTPYVWSICGSGQAGDLGRPRGAMWELRGQGGPLV